ncbi:MAG: GNAT family N-acetyltransferase [Nitriliruptoraceae bacterium]
MLADLAAATPSPASAGLPNLRVRPPQRADLRALDALLQAAASARGRPPALRREDLELRWLQLGDPREAVVALAGDDLVAYASASHDTDPFDGSVTIHLDLQVHPAWSRQGLGGWLLDLATQVGYRQAADAGQLGHPATDATQLGHRHTADTTSPATVRIRTALTDGSEQERAWFAARGFAPRRHLLDLHLDLHAPPPAPRWPADIQVRAYRPGADDHVLWGVHQQAFAEVATHLPLDLDDLLRDRDPAADPDLVLLAEHLDPGAGTEVVGIALSQAGTEVAATDGWVRDLAVLPTWRRRGIAMSLLRESFARFRARGLTGAALEVDDVTLDGAVALYRRAGMRVTRRTDVLERRTDLRGQPSPTRIAQIAAG